MFFCIWRNTTYNYTNFGVISWICLCGLRFSKPLSTIYNCNFSFALFQMLMPFLFVCFVRDNGQQQDLWMDFLLPDPMTSWTTIDILHFNVVGSRHYRYTIISCKQNSQFWKRGFVGLMEMGKWSSHAIVESKGWVFGNGNFT